MVYLSSDSKTDAEFSWKKQMREAQEVDKNGKTIDR